MANPQPDQFTKISNEILEKIMQCSFNGTQFRIIMCIWRYTYGFKRKSARLSISFISKATGIPARNVRKEISRMIEANIITEFVKPDKNTTREIGFNKDYDQWIICTRGLNRPEDELAHSTGDELAHRGEDELAHSPEDELDPQERKPKESIKENIKESLFAHWNTLKIIEHKKLTPDISKALDKVIKDPEYFITCMNHYATALHDTNYKFCSYSWTLKNFINRENGYKSFADDGEKWINYQNAKKKATQSSGLLPCEKDL